MFAALPVLHCRHPHGGAPLPLWAHCWASPNQLSSFLYPQHLSSFPLPTPVSSATLSPPPHLLSSSCLPPSPFSSLSLTHPLPLLLSLAQCSLWRCGVGTVRVEWEPPGATSAFPQHRPRCRVGGERVSLAGVELSAGDGHTAAAMSWATPSTRSRPAAVGCGEKGTSRRTPSPPAWRDPEATDGQPPQIPATRTALPQGRGGLIMVYKVRAVGGRRDH